LTASALLVALVLKDFFDELVVAIAEELLAALIDSDCKQTN